MKWKLLGALLTVVIGLAAYGGKVLATPGNAGFQATTLAHATFGDLRLVGHGPTPRAWDALLLTHNQSDLYVQSNIWQPGGSTGWHTHPGPSLIIVTKGVLTEYEGDDPTCAPHVYDASNGPVGFVDPASAIARRLDALIGAARPGASIDREGTAIFTSGDEPPAALQKTLLRHGLAFTPAAMIGFATA